MAGEERSFGGCRDFDQEPQTGEWGLWRPSQSSEEGTECGLSLLEVGYRKLAVDI